MKYEWEGAERTGGVKRKRHVEDESLREKKKQVRSKTKELELDRKEGSLGTGCSSF